jgi:hypothetical protein
MNTQTFSVNWDDKKEIQRLISKLNDRYSF